MNDIGTFTKNDNGFAGTVRTLNLNVKVKIVPNDKGSDSAPDFRIVTSNGYDLGAAWKKTSEAGRDYLSVTLDDPSLSATIYASLLEADEGKYTLIWSRSRSAG